MPDMDYSKLLGRIKEYGHTQKSVSENIGISEGQLSQKLSGKYLFKQSEIIKICNLLEIDGIDIGEYFFKPKVEKNSTLEKEKSRS